jgi:hypothetical protein
MKKLAILSAIALSGLIYNTANAQVRVSLGLHFGLRPVSYVPVQVVEQAPVYDENTQVYNDNNDNDYYYLPDVDAYYNVNAQSYYYYNGDNWITCAYLPGAYSNYDWRSGRRFEVRGYRPYMHDDVYRSRYNGREIAEWRNYNRENNYGRNENFNHDAYRNDNHFDNRGRGFNRPDTYRRNGDHFDNRGQGFNRPETYRRNDDHFDNRGQGRFNQPSNENHDNRGQGGQPSYQNNGDHNRDNRSGNEHFAQNYDRPAFTNHRLARF